MLGLFVGGLLCLLFNPETKCQVLGQLDCSSHLNQGHPQCVPPSLLVRKTSDWGQVLNESGVIPVDATDYVLECEANYPVQLVCDSNEKRKLTLAKTVASWLKVFYKDFHDLSSYTFKVYQMLSFTAPVKSQQFACQSLENPALQHSLRFETDEEGENSTLNLDKGTTVGGPLDLPSVVESTDACDALFYYEEDSENSYNFRCEFEDGTPGEVEQFPCGSLSACNNILRKGKLITDCWSRFNPSNNATCSNCTAKSPIPNFIGSVTICQAEDRESNVGTIVFYGLPPLTGVQRPPIFFSEEEALTADRNSVVQIAGLENIQKSDWNVSIECRAPGFITTASMQIALEFEGNNSLYYLDVLDKVGWRDQNSYRFETHVLLTEQNISRVFCFIPLEGTYEWINASHAFKFQDETVAQTGVIVVSTLIPILFLIGVVIFILLLRIRRLKRELRDLTEEEIHDFKYGNKNFDPNNPLASVNDRPFNQELEIDRKLFELHENCVLGSGQFGVVMKGFLLIREEGEEPEMEEDEGKAKLKREVVAVKTVRADVDVESFKALLSEIKIMAYLERHPNVICLLGTCTANIKQREVWAALEFCGNGDLLEYLKKSRPTFKNFLVHQNLQSGNHSQFEYQNTMMTEYSNKSFSTLDLFRISTEIANGMKYLTLKNVIHGDLAARNVLLTDSMQVKISDFGLSRQLLEYSNYVKKQQVPLPWKWMAIESLRDREFSIKSDVWSFGVLLWEIFSLGESPYPLCAWNIEFIDQISSGYRMKAPNFANDQVYRIMLDCWCIKPDERKSFEEIHAELEGLTAELHSQFGGDTRV